MRMDTNELEEKILKQANDGSDLNFEYNLQAACRRFRVKCFLSEGQKFYLFKNGKFGRRVSVQKAACGCLKWARGWENAVDQEERDFDKPACYHD